ncbi:NAD(P)H-dependent flavin oxidoreductase [Pseudodonghicola sp.]|uniref:NAD(P)H-dependent flavin oxidoreductase n=1 Tax=Pseudodonghicola sp. TaxID=1969463 RepID=UPI003A974617
MTLPDRLKSLRLPLIGSPLFIISTPDLVIAQCRAGIVGSFPALNAREKDGQSLEEWILRIKAALAEHDAAHPDRPAAPFAVNQIVHRSNARLERDVELCVKHRVPVWITSLGAQEWVYEAAHSVGAIVLHDVINNRFAHKAIDKGADGLIAVAAGAGGHAGAQSPFALVQEIRDWFDGPLFLSGAIARGDSLLAALAMGADGGYAGTAFIATEEANAVAAYKRMIAEHGAEDIIYSNLFTGVWGNYLKPSIAAAGMDPEALERSDPSKMSFAETREKPKSWKEIWGAGQGIGAIRETVPTAALVDRLEREFQAARARLGLRLAGI